MPKHLHKYKSRESTGAIRFRSSLGFRPAGDSFDFLPVGRILVILTPYESDTLDL